MQLSQRSDDSSKDKDDQDCDHPLLVNKQLVSPLVRSSRALAGTPQEATAATSGFVTSGAVPDPLAFHKTRIATETTLSDVKLADTTPRSKAPRQPVVFVPPTPSQNKVLHKDAFGSDDMDLSELSNDSEVDSMKALSQRVAARTDSMITITKRASILADAVPSAGASGKKVAKRRILDSGDEEALPSSRKGAKGGSKPGTGNTRKALQTVVVSDVEDDTPPAPLKSKASYTSLRVTMCSFSTIGGRPKSIKKNTVAPGDKPKPLVGDSKNPKRKRDDDGDEAAGTPDVQDKPPPVKRARKTAGGRLGTSKPKVVPPAPPSDPEVLKKVRPGMKKNANYGGRTKAFRTSSPARGSPAFSDDFPDILELKTLPVDPRVDLPLVGDVNDDHTPSPPAPPKPKPKSMAAAKPRSIPPEKALPTEKPNTAAMKTKAKTQTGTRARAAAVKPKDVDNVKVVKKGPPQKTKAKAKAKRKPEVVSTDEEESKKGKLELAKDSPAVIEVPSSPPEPPKAILPKRKPISRVTSKEVFFNSLRWVHASLRGANR